ncbi:hypothetical protein SPRG_05421 [Saprolegnia parasitica CBS 223.65]|uniref:Uncharacterized protein n=1 Tax=Saprolegnia parasitica (strain CBS 223.65) TaxID=695850 RepID=A0A067CEN8_SAPPC|nr:hypothetical protein SPRG_05421 [Saprolegnia parasitica CBS 223.65]KDO29179.1 hypothetical protein SPRG_05421 [Saprolegnia parasitica CBS 223.65]|eukprot:XP_012200056.1 hypothetical protein SPRG_05421 [Saprolegnia parasitica CBS 223.65]
MSIIMRQELESDAQIERYVRKDNGRVPLRYVYRSTFIALTTLSNGVRSRGTSDAEEGAAGGTAALHKTTIGPLGDMHPSVVTPCEREHARRSPSQLEQKEQEFAAKKQQIAADNARGSRIDKSFLSHTDASSEAEFKRQTIGLVTAAEYRKRREDCLAPPEPALEATKTGDASVVKPAPKKKKKKATMSFSLDSDDETDAPAKRKKLKCHDVCLAACQQRTACHEARAQGRLGCKRRALQSDALVRVWRGFCTKCISE